MNKEILKLCNDFSLEIRRIVLTELIKELECYKTDEFKQLVKKEYVEEYTSILNDISNIQRKLEGLIEGE